MQPVIQRRVEVVREGGDLLGELALQPGEHVVELQGVRGQMHPSALSCEYG